MNNLLLSASRWKCAEVKPIKHPDPDRPVDGLFINSQYLPGRVHEYSGTESHTRDLAGGIVGT